MSKVLEQYYTPEQISRKRSWFDECLAEMDRGWKPRLLPELWLKEPCLTDLQRSRLQAYMDEMRPLAHGNDAERLAYAQSYWKAEEALLIELADDPDDEISEEAEFSLMRRKYNRDVHLDFADEMRAVKSRHRSNRLFITYISRYPAARAYLEAHNRDDAEIVLSLAQSSRDPDSLLRTIRSNHPGTDAARMASHTLQERRKLRKEIQALLREAEAGHTVYLPDLERALERRFPEITKPQVYRLRALLGGRERVGTQFVRFLP